MIVNDSIQDLENSALYLGDFLLSWTCHQSLCRLYSCCLWHESVTH